jgi:hypothetical protein
VPAGLTQLGPGERESWAAYCGRSGGIVPAVIPLERLRQLCA